MGLTTGIKSIHKNGLFANHQEELYWEYVGFFHGILYSWMLKDPDKRAAIDNGMLETVIPDKIARLVCTYDYHHEEREEFQELYARFVILEATKLLGENDLKNVIVDEYGCTVSELVRDMAAMIVVHDTRIKAEDREVYRMVAFNGCGEDEVACQKNKKVAWVSALMKRLDAKAIKYAERLLK